MPLPVESVEGIFMEPDMSAVDRPSSSKEHIPKAKIPQVFFITKQRE
jgi:hypothetical protein